MPFVNEQLIRATMDPETYSDLTSKKGAADFAVKQTNSEIGSLLKTEFETLDDCPENIKDMASVVGRYWLHSFGGALINKDDAVIRDYNNAIKHLKNVASGKEAGLTDPDDTDNQPVSYWKRDRLFDHWLESGGS